MNQVDKTKIKIDDDLIGPDLRWSTHPLKKRPLAATLVTIFILVISMFIFSMTASSFFTGLSLLVLFGSLAKFYMPTYFRMTQEYVIIKSTTQTIVKRWSELRSYYTDKNGVLLSPFVAPSRLENFRGMYLIFNDNKEDVVAFIDSHITKDYEPAVINTEDES